MFSIKDWNINPNQDWYVKIYDSGAKFTVDLYSTEADALSGTNLIATGTEEFGSCKEVTLTQEEDPLVVISYFNLALTYHLKVTGFDSDPMKIYHLFPFVDIQEVNDSIYKSSDLIQRRVTHEINKHTHVSVMKVVSIATLIDGVEINDVLKISSVFRGSNTYNLVEEVEIRGNKNSLLSKITAVEYLDFERA